VSPAPRVYRAEGIVLRRRNLGEADSIFTVFSVEEGKFDAIARGVRKPKSRMRGHLEPLTRSQLLVARGRTLDVFTQAQTVEAYRPVREDLGRTVVAVYCAELVDRFTAERHPQPELFELLVEALEALAAGGGTQVARWFEVQLLSLTGFGLQLSGCVICAAKLQPEETLISPGAGGAVCRSCRPRAGSGRIVSLNTLKALRFAQGVDAIAFTALRVDANLSAELEAVLGDVVRFVLEREPNSGRHIGRLTATPAQVPASVPDAPA
jgi:DNA repair protein RecO (recombination protein O)